MWHILYVLNKNLHPSVFWGVAVFRPNPAGAKVQLHPGQCWGVEGVPPYIQQLKLISFKHLKLGSLVQFIVYHYIVLNKVLSFKSEPVQRSFLFFFTMSLRFIVFPNCCLCPFLKLVFDTEAPGRISSVNHILNPSLLLVQHFVAVNSVQAAAFNRRLFSKNESHFLNGLS